MGGGLQAHRRPAHVVRQLGAGWRPNALPHPNAQAWLESMAEQCDKIYHLWGAPLASERVTLFGRNYLKYR